jgi:hypothetical protein
LQLHPENGVCFTLFFLGDTFERSILLSEILSNEIHLDLFGCELPEENGATKEGMHGI